MVQAIQGIQCVRLSTSREDQKKIEIDRIIQDAVGSKLKTYFYIALAAIEKKLKIAPKHQWEGKNYTIFKLLKNQNQKILSKRQDRDPLRCRSAMSIRHSLYAVIEWWWVASFSHERSVAR